MTTQRMVQRLGRLATVMAAWMIVGLPTVRAVAAAANTPPQVQWTSPTNGQTFKAGAPILIGLYASDPDGRVSSVTVYDGTKVLAVRTNTVTKLPPGMGMAINPYPFNWTNAAVGTHDLSAVAIDDLGATTKAGGIRITVLPTNAPPTVAITAPVDGSLIQGASAKITAEAADTDGTVSEVGFYANNLLIGSVSKAPYTVAWTNLISGNYTLTARAKDNSGATTTSKKVQVTVVAPNQAPVVEWTSPTNGSILRGVTNVTLRANASDRDGSVLRVEFLVDGAVVGTALRAPFNASWKAPTLGVHELKARATDNQGAVTETTVQKVTVRPANVLPTVSITATSPVAGKTQVIKRNGTVTIEATATDPDGAIKQVEFAADGRVFATVTRPLPGVSPAVYGGLWTNVTSGVHTFTAVAVDDAGASTRSEPVKLDLLLQNTPPTVSLVTTNPLKALPAGGLAYVVTATNGVGRFSFSTALSDADGDAIRTLEVFVDGRIEQTLHTNTTFAPRTTVLLEKLPVGLHYVSVKAQDDLGASSTSDLPYPVMVANSTVNAKLVLTAPTSGQIIRTNTLVVKATLSAEGPQAVSKPVVEILLDDKVAGVMTPGTGASSNLFTGTLTGLTTGSHTVSAQARFGDIQTVHSLSVGIAVALPQPDPVLVSVAATVAETSESTPAKPGVFTFTRTGSTKTLLNVHYLVSGTAQNGVDYERLAGLVVIPAGQTSTTLKVVPLKDTLKEADETVVVGVNVLRYLVAPGPEDAYNAGNPAEAKLVIHDAVTTDTNLPPKVAILSPANGASVAQGTDVPFKIQGTDPDGYLTRVELLEGNQVVASHVRTSLVVPPSGQVETNTLVFKAPPVGKHTLLARVTDNKGKTADSTPVTITVESGNTGMGAVVTVVATTPFATESDPANPGVFTLTRTGPTNTLLRVDYALAGTAVAGVDYQKLSGTAIIPAGHYSVAVNVVPIADKTVEGDETVILALLQKTFIMMPPAEDNYSVGKPEQATVTIKELIPVDPPVSGSGQPIVTLSSPSALVLVQGTNSGWLHLTRSGGVIADPLPVLLTFEGTAVAGTDYEKVPTSVQFPAGKTNLDVEIKPIVHAGTTKVVTLLTSLSLPICPAIYPVPPTCYLLGKPSSSVIYLVTSPNIVLPPLPPGVASAFGPSLDVAAGRVPGARQALLIDAQTNADGSMSLRFAGEPGVAYQIEVSPDGGQTWETLGVVTDATGQLILQDMAPGPDAANLQYRATQVGNP